MEKSAVFLALLSLFFITQFGFSQDQYSKFEISTSAAYYSSNFKATHLSQYNPPFLSGAYTSWAKQELNFEGKKNWGYGVAAAFFPAPFFGIQILGRYFKVPFSGKNSPYTYQLKYKDLTYDKEMGWPETSGNLKQYVFGLNAVLRLWLAKGMSLSLSGGGSTYYFEGEAASLGFTKFWLSEKYLIESETYQLMCKFDSQTKTGYNAGAEFDLAFYQNLSLCAEFRYFFCPETTFKLSIKENDLIAQNLPLINQYLPLKDLKIKPSFSNIGIGLKYKF